MLSRSSRRFASSMRLTTALRRSFSIMEPGHINHDLPVMRLGHPAPAFNCKAYFKEDFLDVDLSYLQGHWCVVFFYPLDFTFVCPTEVAQFNDRLAEFEALNCGVVGVSIDSHHVHKAWTKTPRNQGGIGPMNIPLLGDMGGSMTYDWGAMMDEGHSCRATYILDPDTIVRHMSFNDPPVGRNVDEVLRLVAGYQFAAENDGMVCPVGWKKGDAVINKNESEKFFSTIENKSNASEGSDWFGSKR